MFTAALFTKAKPGKQPKCPATDDWPKKMWCMYAVGYYSATTKKEILRFATTWMDLEDIMLSERSQMEKDRYFCMILHIFRI